MGHFNIHKFFKDQYLAEGRLNDKYTKDSLLKALGEDDDAFIVVGSDINNQFVIYNPNSTNQDNADMWGPESVFAVDEDGLHSIASKALTVEPPPERVELNVGADGTASEGHTFNRLISFADPTDQNTDGWEYEIAWGEDRKSVGRERV